MMIKMQYAVKLCLFMGMTLAINACSSIDVMQNKAVRLDSEVYYYNNSGEIELTEEILSACICATVVFLKKDFFHVDGIAFNGV